MGYSGAELRYLAYCEETHQSVNLQQFFGSKAAMHVNTIKLL